jgi:CubicO group peptidase (beta-lactamase class C family)
MVEQGLVGLDEELTDVLPFVQYENQFADEQPVLVRHLLSHTSGIDDELLPELTAVYAGEDECELPLTEVLSVELPAVQTQPGQSYSYSGLGYGLLGAILEQIAGQPFEDVVQSRVLEPLGMTTSSFRLTPQIEESLATGYIKTAEGIQPVEYRCGYLRAGGNLHASANDLAKLLILFAMDGSVEGRQFLTPETLAVMQEAQVRLETLEYGLGVMTISLPDGHRVIGHAGGVEGFNSHAWLEPESGTGVVVLVNCSAVACVQANERVRNAAFYVMLSGTPED